MIYFFAKCIIRQKKQIPFIIGKYYTQSLLLVPLGLQDLINNLFITLLINSSIFTITKDFKVNCILMVIILMIPITLVHECIHGLCYKLFAGKVIFGFKGIYEYCQEVSGGIRWHDFFLESYRKYRRFIYGFLPKSLFPLHIYCY